VTTKKKTKTPDPATVEIPVTPPKTQDPVTKRRTRVANYLHIIAEMIQTGKCLSFDLNWHFNIGDEPAGALVMSASSLHIPPEPEPIPFEDLSEKLKTDEQDDKGCGNADCGSCSNKC